MPRTQVFPEVAITGNLAYHGWVGARVKRWPVRLVPTYADAGSHSQIPYTKIHRH